MHEAHPLHPDPAARERGRAHLRDTIALAADLGVPRVVAVCGYGNRVCERPFESCLAFFREAAVEARSRGVRILIEPLSPARVSAMNRPADVEALLDALGMPDVFGSVLDTGHLLDAGLDVAAVLSCWRHRVDELQLRGKASAPPTADLPSGAWIDALPKVPDVVCVEHRGPIDEDELAGVAETIRAALNAR